MSTVKTPARPAASMTHAVPSKKPENDKTVGRTYGERAQRPVAQSHSHNSQNSRFLSEKDKQKALENFGGANDRFQKNAVRPTGAGGTPYKAQRVDMLEKGLSQALASSHSRPDDNSLTDFLNDVIGNPALQSQRALRNHLLTRK